MSADTRTVLEKLAAADAAKLVRWTADRLRQPVSWLWWQGARLRLQLVDALGAGGKLPPGSLAASCVHAATSDDHFYLKQQRRYGPVFKLFWGSRDLKICIIGFPLGRRLIHQHRGSLHPVSTDISPLVPAEYLRAMSPAIHPHYRGLFKSALRDDLVTACESGIRHIVRAQLEALARRGATEPSSPEHLHGALDGITMHTLFLVILGVRPEAAVVPALEAAYHRLGPDGFIAPIGPEQRAAFPVIRGHVLQIVEDLRHGRQAEYGDSVLGRMMRAGGSDIDDTVIGNAIYIVERARHDLRDMLCWIVKYLSDCPPVVAELRAASACPGAGMSLAEACVLETLRLDQAETVNRKAMASFTFRGHHVPKGSWLSILMRETHRDPASFDDPHTFRPQRFLTRTYTADQYAPFGIDEHQCIGRSLTIRLGAIFIEELVQRYTWTVTADGPRLYGQFHWQPSPAFAIGLRPADALE